MPRIVNKNNCKTRELQIQEYVHRIHPLLKIEISFSKKGDVCLAFNHPCFLVMRHPYKDFYNSKLREETLVRVPDYEKSREAFERAKPIIVEEIMNNFVFCVESGTTNNTVKFFWDGSSYYHYYTGQEEAKHVFPNVGEYLANPEENPEFRMLQPQPQPPVHSEWEDKWDDPNRQGTWFEGKKLRKVKEDDILKEFAEINSWVAVRDYVFGSDIPESEGDEKGDVTEPVHVVETREEKVYEGFDCKEEMSDAEEVVNEWDKEFGVAWDERDPTLTYTRVGGGGEGEEHERYIPVLGEIWGVIPDGSES
ncbi:MAG: hypothetical protein RLN62_04260 [Rickettsiales bacterium]